MRAAALSLVAILSGGCHSGGGFHPGWLMLANADGTAVMFSERFEYVDRIAADRVGMLLSMTLAPDRVPPAPDGGVAEARALELINLSNETVALALVALTLRGTTDVALPATVELAPGQTLLLGPSLGRGSVYQPRAQDFRFRYRYRDELFEIGGTADRLPVRELEERTHAGLAWRFK